jgi:hypothetical protein
MVDTKRVKVIPMRKSRVVAGLVGVGAAVALTVGSAAIATGAQPVDQPALQAAAPAKTDQGSVGLVPGRGVADLGERWYVHGVPFEFSVNAGAPRARAAEGASVFVSWPLEIALVSSTGDGWRCSEVEGGAACDHPALVEPEQSWPALTVRAKGAEAVKDTLDVYLRGVGSADAHVGVPFTYDTST